MKHLLLASFLVAAFCVSGFAQTKCGQTVELNAGVSFCIPDNWKTLDPEGDTDRFAGPGAIQLLLVRAAYGDSDLEKEVERTLTREFGPIVRAKLDLATLSSFESDSKVRGKKLVFSSIFSGREFVNIGYVIQISANRYAKFLWTFPKSDAEALAGSVDDSMAHFLVSRRN
jgi:hypothetical protein